MTTPLAAANAYSSLAKLASPGGVTKATGPGDGSFGDLLKGAMDAVAQAGQKSDAQSKAMVQGKGDIVDVVTAVSESEVAIDALVSVRDRVIAAYEDILKMPI